MSQSSSPAAPQSEVANTAEANAQAHIDAYTDRSITKRNVEPTEAVPTPLPAKSGSTTLGEVTVYDPAGTDHEPANADVNTPAAPNSWKPGRDPYKVDGMVGQDFFKHPS